MEGQAHNKADKSVIRPPKILLPGIQEIAQRRKHDDEEVLVEKLPVNSER